MRQSKLVSALALFSILAGVSVATGAAAQRAARPTIADLLDKLTEIQAMITEIDPTAEIAEVQKELAVVRADTSRVPADPASEDSIHSAVTDILSNLWGQPRGVFFNLNLSDEPLSSGQCRIVQTADPGHTFLGTFRITLPAAGVGTSLTVNSRPTDSTPYHLIKRQQNFNTAEIVEGFVYTGVEQRVCNGSFGNANTGSIRIEGTAIQLPLE